MLDRHRDDHTNRFPVPVGATIETGSRPGGNPRRHVRLSCHGSAQHDDHDVPTRCLPVDRVKIRMLPLSPARFYVAPGEWSLTEYATFAPDVAKEIQDWLLEIDGIESIQIPL